MIDDFQAHFHTLNRMSDLRTGHYTHRKLELLRYIHYLLRHFKYLKKYIIFALVIANTNYISCVVCGLVCKICTIFCYMILLLLICFHMDLDIYVIYVYIYIKCSHLFSGNFGLFLVVTNYFHLYFFNIFDRWRLVNIF